MWCALQRYSKRAGRGSACFTEGNRRCEHAQHTGRCNVVCVCCRCKDLEVATPGAAAADVSCSTTAPPPPLPLAHCAWCPGELVPLEEMAEHMRISLIDPRWKEQRDAMLSKLKDTTKAGDEEISRNLLSLARTRPDIFGGWRAEGVGGVGLFSREGRSASLLWILGVCWGGGGFSNQVVSKPECGVCAATCTQNQGPFLWHRVTRLHWMKCNAWLTSWVSVSSTT